MIIERRKRALGEIKINKKDSSIHLTHLEDINKCLIIITERYGEVISIALNKSEIKRIINWLNKWVNFMENKR